MKSTFLFILALFIFMSCNIKTNIPNNEAKTLKDDKEITEVSTDSNPAVETFLLEQSNLTKAFSEEDNKNKYIENFNETYINQNILTKMGFDTITSFSEIATVLSKEQINRIETFDIDCIHLKSFDDIVLFPNIEKLTLLNITFSGIQGLLELENLTQLNILNASEDILNQLSLLTQTIYLGIRNCNIIPETFSFPPNISSLCLAWCTGNVLDVLHRIPYTVNGLLISEDYFSKFEDIEFLFEFDCIKSISIYINDYSTFADVNENKDKWRGKEVDYWNDEW